MLYIIGTLAALAEVKEHLPPLIYKEVYPIVEMLDQQYGSQREVDTDDGGYVIVTDNLEELNAKHFNIYKLTPEQVSYLGDNKEYINVLFLFHNEFGVNVILPAQMPLPHILKEID